MQPLMQVIITAGGAVLGSLMCFIAIRVAQIYKLTQLHDRMIFGEDGVDGWEGILKICLNEVKKNEQTITILNDLIQWIMRNKIDSSDGELQELYEKTAQLKMT